MTPARLVPIGIGLHGACLQPLTTLPKDLAGDLGRVVTRREPHEGFAAIVAELFRFTVGVAGPADGQQHYRDVGASDVRLKPFNRLMLSGFKPDQFLEPE